jgi:predicted DsbA family dithiol-disulfide isomerase
MAKFQLFYDYECPFCKKGYETLTELLPGYDGIEVEWRPIESHPRPEDHPPHTDLCVAAFYAAVEMGADMAAFHAALFRGAAVQRQNVEHPEVLAAILDGVVDRGLFLEILAAGRYAGRAAENNDLAYEKKGVWFVPAFRGIDTVDITLDAKGGQGVTRDEIKAFLDRISR